MIYFIQQGDDGPIKIGFARDRPAAEGRLRTFQTGHSEPLTLLAVLPGDLAYEAALHERFAAVRVRGEWFEPTAALMRQVRRAQVAVDEGDLVAARARWAELGYLTDAGSLTPAGAIYLLTLEDCARETGVDPDHPAGAELIREWAAVVSG